jgi:16S rRNA (uracil1498-N3)-methyltransferase
LGDLAKFSEATMVGAGVRLFCDEERDTPGLLASLPRVRRASDEVAILVGPEGGWDDRERDTALAAGWAKVSLGPQVLRTETAALAAAAVISAVWKT